MLSKKEFESFRKETEEALQKVAQKYNVNIKSGKIKYTDNSFNLDLLVSKKDIGGKTFEQVEFEKYCLMYGLKPEDYRKQFIMNGDVFIITGFKPRATKMPIIAVTPEGKSYKFGEDTVKRLLGK
jgi:thiol-disulfide isomerase/thioredoxin